MGWATAHIEMLKTGETVTFSPRGKSMEPIVKDGQQVTVEPVFYGNGVSKGDVVLCKSRGYEYLHLVIGYDKKQHQGSKPNRSSERW